MRASALVLVGLLPAVSAADPPLLGGELEPRIYGGTPVESCGWPSTVSMNGNCTATLVHPQVVIYAAHCGSSYGAVRFGETIQGGPGFSAPTEFCRTNPAYNGMLGQGVDFAFCKLAQPVTEVEIVPILMGCETAILAPGTEVVVVGFGTADNGPYGIKREVTTVVNSVGSEAYVGGNGVGACNGDSGGPVFVKLPSELNGDDTWRVFGVTSWGPEGCLNGAHFGMMHNAVTWVESETGIDITPCHDVDGTWKPGIDCRFFPKEPMKGHGAWPACGPGPTGGFSAICGEPAGGPDEDPPIVTITAPASGMRFDSDPMTGNAMVTVSAIADDGEGWGVQDVRLLLNGNEVPNSTDPSEPYDWPGAFPKGQYTVVAVATDYKGQEGMSEPVYFGVDMDAPEPPSEEDTGDTDDTGDSSGDGTGDGGATMGADDPAKGGCGCGLGGRGSAGLWLLVLGCFGARPRRRR